MKVDTIEQFKIKEWIAKNFEEGSLQIEYTEHNKAIVTDKSGAKMQLVCSNTNNYVITHIFL